MEVEVLRHTLNEIHTEYGHTVAVVRVVVALVNQNGNGVALPEEGKYLATSPRFSAGSFWPLTAFNLRARTFSSLIAPFVCFIL